MKYVCGDCGRCWRWAMGGGMMFGVGGCLPNNFLSNLAGSSITSVVGALLTDALNVFLPPIS